MDRQYLFEGGNPLLREKEIDKLIAKIKMSDDEVVKYDLSVTSIDRVIEDLDTYGMFAKRKIIIAVDPVFLYNKTNKDNNTGITYDTTRFEKYINNPGENILIISSDKINNRLKVSTLVKKIFKVISVSEPNYVNYIKDYTKNYKMDNNTIYYLIDKVGNNLLNLEQEMNKLMQYKLDDRVINIEDIDLMISKKYDNTIFDLIDAILSKNKKKSYELYNHFINSGTEIFQMLVLLSNQVRLIYNVKVLGNMNDLEISSKLGVKEYPVKLARSKGYKYGKDELLNLLYNLSIIDEDIKSGKQIIDISFLTFIMQM